MELRTAESKSLIRRKTVKVTAGSGSLGRQTPTPPAHVFVHRFFSLFKAFLFCLFQKINVIYANSAQKLHCLILFQLFIVSSFRFSRFKSRTSLMFLTGCSTRFNNLLKIIIVTDKRETQSTKPTEICTACNFVNDRL